MARGLFNLSPRKSLKLGALKVNLSKGGIGVSTGIKGLRVGFNSKGQTYTSIGKGMLRQTKYSKTTHSGQKSSEIQMWSTEHVNAVLLSLFFGWCGIHRFYLGHKKMAYWYLLFFWTAIPLAVSVLEAFYFIAMTESNFQKRYIKKK